MKVAQLALKFRAQRSIQARIVVFVGSPVNDIDMKKLTKVGKQLKKNNIAVDIISVGEHASNTELLQQFVKGVEKRDGATSNLIIVPPGTYIEDSIKQSSMGAVETEEDMDPMLALALAESRAMAGQPPLQTSPPMGNNSSATSTKDDTVQNEASKAYFVCFKYF